MEVAGLGVQGSLLGVSWRWVGGGGGPRTCYLETEHEPGVQGPTLTAQGMSLRSWVLPLEPKK